MSVTQGCKKKVFGSGMKVSVTVSANLKKKKLNVNRDFPESQCHPKASHRTRGNMKQYEAACEYIARGVLGSKPRTMKRYGRGFQLSRTIKPGCHYVTVTQDGRN